MAVVLKNISFIGVCFNINYGWFTTDLPFRRIMGDSSLADVVAYFVIFVIWTIPAYPKRIIVFVHSRFYGIIGSDRIDVLACHIYFYGFFYSLLLP